MDVWLTQRGGDEQVWELDAVGSYRAAKHPATGFARVAVAPDRTLWAVASSGTLWRRLPSGQWLQANTVGTVTDALDDVTVTTDGTVWLTAKDGTLWTTTDGSVLVERTVFVPFRRLAAAPGGLLLGISFHGALCRFNGSFWEILQGADDYIDVSVAFEGLIWVVRGDGVILTSSDGSNFGEISGEGGFENVAAGRYGISWGAKADGSLSIWHPAPPVPTPPAPPPPPPPPPSAPRISVTVEGSGFDSVFLVTGSRFTPNVNVSVRVTRIEKGTVHDVRFNTRSDGAGEIVARLPIPCFSGVELNFSATDGRSNPADLTVSFGATPRPWVAPDAREPLSVPRVTTSTSHISDRTSRDERRVGEGPLAWAALPRPGSVADQWRFGSEMDSRTHGPLDRFGRGRPSARSVPFRWLIRSDNARRRGATCVGGGGESPERKAILVVAPLGGRRARIDARCSAALPHRGKVAR